MNDLKSTLVIFFYSSTCLLVFSLVMLLRWKLRSQEEAVFLLSQGCNLHLPKFMCYNQTQVAYALFYGALDFICQNAFVLALQKGKCGPVMVTYQLSVFYSFLFDTLYFKHIFSSQ
jgi:hypothetical protein